MQTILPIAVPPLLNGEHHPAEGSAIRQRGTESRQAGLGIQAVVPGVNCPCSELEGGVEETGSTVKLNMVCAVSPLPVAYTVTAYVPGVVVSDVFMIITPPHGGVQEDGESEYVEPEGRPATK